MKRPRTWQAVQLPFSGLRKISRPRRAASLRMAGELWAGLALYAALLHLHGPVIGVDPFLWL